MDNNSHSHKETQILKFLTKNKYATSRQLARLFFNDSLKPSTMLRRTNLLTKQMKEKDVIRHLQRRVGGVRSGSGSYVWYITTKGLNQLKQTYPNLKVVRQNKYEPSMHHLRHSLAITELYVLLNELASGNSNFKLEVFQFEPDCWRGWLDSLNGRSIIKPDAFVEVSLDDYIDSYFIELDKSTESLNRIINKSKHYIRYYNLNIEQNKNQGVFPLVLWVVPDEKRKLAIETRIQETLNNYWELFQVITLDEFKDYVSGGIKNG